MRLLQFFNNASMNRLNVRGNIFRNKRFSLSVNFAQRPRLSACSRFVKRAPFHPVISSALSLVYQT